MNPGFMAIWIVLIMIILMATGWKDYVAPDISRRMMVAAVISMVIALASSLWLLPFHVFGIEIHVGVCVLLFLALSSLYNGTESWGHVTYLLVCMLMIAVIWGFVRKMYSYDPVFYWINPNWDAPLLAGLFCGAFASKANQQFAMISGGAVIGEIFNAFLQTGGYMGYIGELRWWDSFWIAFATARIFSILLKALRVAGTKLQEMLWQIRGGRSS